MEMEDVRVRPPPEAGNANTTGGCPLCPLARPHATRLAEGISIDESMARFFGISRDLWLGWPLCTAHLLEYHQSGQASSSSSSPSSLAAPAATAATAPTQQADEAGDATKTMDDKPVVEAGEPTRRKRRRKAAAERQQQAEEKSANSTSTTSNTKSKTTVPLEAVPLQPIGLFESCFPERHGTPRQGLLVPSSRGRLRLRRSEAMTNPREALVGLEGFSHVWLVFLFHNNAGNPHNKIHPPRLGGRKLGMLATRTPHRPCPIGLSLARVESIEGDTLHLAGVDLVNNTPVLDVKPYIARYDAHPDARTADWLAETDNRETSDAAAATTDGSSDGGGGGYRQLRVEMTEEAVESLRRNADALRFFKGDWERARRCIEEVLALDIRTLHMKRRHKEGTYGVSIDVMNVSFVVNAESGLCTVERIDLWPESYDHHDFGEVKRRRVGRAADQPPA